MLGFSWLAEDLLVSVGGLSSLELVSYHTSHDASSYTSLMLLDLISTVIAEKDVGMYCMLML